MMFTPLPWRCGNCNHRLTDIDLRHGRVQSLCPKRECRAMNWKEVRDGRTVDSGFKRATLMANVT